MTLNALRALLTERAAKTKPLLAELAELDRDDSKPAAYRQRRERELRSAIAGVNDTYGRRIIEAATEAAKEPQRRWATGTALKPEQVAEAQLYAEQYRGKTRGEQRHLLAEIAADLDAGASSRAVVKARAAAALNLPLGPIEDRLADADTAKRDARDSLDAIEALRELALAEPLRELAAAGFATPAERTAVKVFASGRGLRPDAPFPAQIELDYAGPSVEANGVPNAPFPERYDPERDRQRRDAERHRDNAAAREWYAANRR